MIDLADLGIESEAQNPASDRPKVNSDPQTGSLFMTRETVTEKNPDFDVTPSAVGDLWFPMTRAAALIGTQQAGICVIEDLLQYYATSPIPTFVALAGVAEYQAAEGDGDDQQRIAVESFDRLRMLRFGFGDRYDSGRYMVGKAGRLTYRLQAWACDLLEEWRTRHFADTAAAAVSVEQELLGGRSIAGRIWDEHQPHFSKDDDGDTHSQCPECEQSWPCDAADGLLEALGMHHYYYGSMASEWVFDGEGLEPGRDADDDDITRTDADLAAGRIPRFALELLNYRPPVPDDCGSDDF